jgi:cytochrome c oxidase subunit 2
LRGRDFPRPAAPNKLPRPWQNAVLSGAAPNIMPAVGGKRGLTKGRFSRRGAHKTMLVLKRLIAFVVTSVAVFAGGCAAWAAATGEPQPWQIGLQPGATPVMDDIIWFHDFLLWIIAAITLFVLTLLVVVMVKFNARANPVPSRTTHNTTIEVIWTVVPVLILVAIAVPSFRLLFYQLNVPKADLTVKATGKQWFWTYDYPDAKIEFDSLMVQQKDLKPGQPRLLTVDNDLVVPVNKTVKVLTTGADVIHSWAVPSFGVKIDAIPGRLNETWFKAEREGMYYGQCSELCGRSHAFMPIVVRVVSEKDYAAWLADAKKKFAYDDGSVSKVAVVPEKTVPEKEKNLTAVAAADDAK